MLLIVVPVGASAQQLPQPCHYIREFKRLFDTAPDTIGACTSRRIFTSNGDVLQYTAHGLMVRRESDNRTAFTDGHLTWINGPVGLVSRLNSDRFPWEHDTRVESGDLPEPVARLGPASAYPNSAFTPGATEPRVTQRSIGRTVCSDDYLARAQPQASFADRVMRRQMAHYNYPDANPADYELDELVPIELGGDPHAPSNLWPQPYSPAPGAHEKDLVERYLRQQVCSGAMSLAAAQQAILNDWVAVYEQLPAEGSESGG